MFAEAAEAAAAIRRQHARNAKAVARLGELLRDKQPRVFITLARGSSDNAATFARYLVETHAGVLTSSASPWMPWRTSGKAVRRHRTLSPSPSACLVATSAV